MPNYDYKCPECGQTEVIHHSIQDSDNSYHCPECDWVMKKVFSATPAVFKGQGWAKITEYKPKKD